MAVARDGGAAAAGEKIEIDAIIGLKDVINVKLGPAASWRERRVPGSPASGESFLIDLERQPATWHIERMLPTSGMPG